MNSTSCLLTGIILFILLSGTITAAATPDRLDTIMDRGSLIIAIEPLGAPYGSIIQGAERSPGTNCPGDCYTANQMTGFDIAVTAEIARQLGLDACYINPDHDQIIGQNWSGWDLYTSYYITNDRLRDYYFTKPTVSESSRFYTLADHTEITGPADLSGKIIGVGNATAQLQYLMNTLDIPGTVNKNQVTNPVIKEYADEYGVLDALLAGAVDGVLISESTGKEAIANGTPIIGLEPAPFTGYSGLAISKESQGDAKTLVKKLDGIISGMHADGELSNLSQRYLGRDLTRDAASFDLGSLNQTSG